MRRKDVLKVGLTTFCRDGASRSGRSAIQGGVPRLMHVNVKKLFIKWNEKSAGDKINRENLVFRQWRPYWIAWLGQKLESSSHTCCWRIKMWFYFRKSPQKQLIIILFRQQEIFGWLLNRQPLSWRLEFSQIQSDQSI